MSGLLEVFTILEQHYLLLNPPIVTNDVLSQGGPSLWRSTDRAQLMVILYLQFGNHVKAWGRPYSNKLSTSLVNGCNIVGIHQNVPSGIYMHGCLTTQPAALFCHAVQGLWQVLLLLNMIMFSLDIWYVHVLHPTTTKTLHSLLRFRGAPDTIPLPLPSLTAWKYHFYVIIMSWLSLYTEMYV